jgi:tetratricopeptide (TPR) repeat protein
VAGIYAAGFWSNQFVYDDHEVIENQYPIHNFHDLAEIFREPHYLNFPYYRPITRATFALQKTIFGDNPRPYHLFNAILAGLVTLAAYALLCRKNFGLNPLGALLAALWFGLHPALSECVYPAASGRESLLPAFFILLATWAYLGPGIISYWLAMFCFVVGVLCKEQAIVLPGIFILADLTIRPAAPMARRLLRYLPMGAIFIAYFYLRHLIFNGPTLHWEFSNHPTAPLLSLLYGLQTAVVPFMSLHYEPTYEVWFEPGLVVLSILALVALMAWTARNIKSTGRVAVFWLGWFIILQLPTAHLLRQEAPYSERYVALAILGIAATVAELIQRVNRLLIRRAAAVIAVGWISLFAGVTYLRGSYYMDETAFVLQWLRTNPNSAGAHNGAGYIAQQQHLSKTAIDEYRLALEADPDSKTAHNNLANLLADQGNYAEAAGHYRWILTQEPDDTVAMTNYAQMLSEEAYENHDQQLATQARHLLDRAIELKPKYAQAHYVLGAWNEAFGTKEDALSEYIIALNLRPGWPQVERRLAALEWQPTTLP